MKIVTKRRTLDVSKQTLIMGILNVTPDSFSDGGKYVAVESAVAHAKQMLADGADIIDVGGESTRPVRAKKVSMEEEIRRVIPVILAIRREVSPEVILSIDTYKAAVAKAAIEAGADIINDVSGLQMDTNMPAVAAKYDVPIVVNHMRGTPQTHQKGDIVYTDIIREIKQFFAKKILLLTKAGVAKEKIILDPGFGFGKTVAHNITILNNLSEFKEFALPILIGVSRKNTLGVLLKEEFGCEFAPEERLEAGLAATAIAVFHGAHSIRTHDVLQTRKFLSVFDKMRSS